MDIITGEPSAHGRNSQRACIKWRSQQNVSFIHPNNLVILGRFSLFLAIIIITIIIMKTSKKENHVIFGENGMWLYYSTLFI